jgi:hypothetical protein
MVFAATAGTTEDSSSLNAAALLGELPCVRLGLLLRGEAL